VPTWSIIVTVLPSFRISRRALSQTLGGSILASALVGSTQVVRASRQATDLTVLRLANEVEPAGLDPWMRGYGQTLITRQIYEPLVDVRMTLEGEDVVVEYVPVLAESWEAVDDVTTRFAIRRGVSFHNGETLDAHAVKASFDALNSADAAAAAGSYHLLAATAGAEVVDDFTIDITAAFPNSELIGQVLSLGLVVLPPAMLADQGLDGFAEQPVGTGPYAFSSWTKGQQVVLTGFTDYWNAANVTIVPEATIVTRPEAAVRAQSVTAGETDFAYNIGAEQASSLAASVTGGGFQSSSLRLNNQVEPTSDLNVRLAINHAIDRQGIADTIFLGAATPIAFFGFQPVTLEPYAYDPERARELLQEAGAEGAAVELVYGEGRIPEEDQLAELYKSFLDEIGLNVTLTKLEPVLYNERGALPFAEQPALYMETTSSGNYGEIAGGLADKYGSEGTGTFADPDFDARFATLATMDGEARTTELQAIAEDLHALAPRAWVVAVQQVHGVSDAISANLPLNVFIKFTDLVS
jgi:peptide/nickel transport system substrate-binding protein